MRIKIFIINRLADDPEKAVNDFLKKVKGPATVHIASPTPYRLALLVTYDEKEDE